MTKPTCLQIFIMVAFCALTFIGLVALPHSGPKASPALFFEVLFGGVFCALVGFYLAGKCGGKKEGEWRVVHHCPSCNQVLANVPAVDASLTVPGVNNGVHTVY